MLLLALAALLPQAGADESAVIEEAARSVVALRFKGGHGSGFVIDERGWILTNAHVACSAMPYVVEARAEVDGRLSTLRFQKVLLAGVHPDRDLALVKIDPSEHRAKLKALKIASKPPTPEQTVYAVGFPGDIGDGYVKVKSAGKVLAADRQVYRRAYIENDAVIAPGNSGGPLLVGSGEVVGVVTLQAPETGLGYAVPAWEVRPQIFVPLRQRGPDPAASVLFLNEADKWMRRAQEKKDLLCLAFASQYYEQASFWDPGNDDILLKIAAFYILRDEPSFAAAHVTRALLLNPWPERGSIVYAALAASLDRLGRRSDVDTIAQEALLKFPDRCGFILEILAADHFQAGRWVDAAHLSRRAVRQGAREPEAMNRIHKEARGRMSPEQDGEFLRRDGEIEATETRLRRDADEARRSGKSAITPAFRKFMDGFDGLQREGGGTPGAGGASSAAADADRFSDDEVTRLFVQAQYRIALENFRAARFDQAEEIFAEIAEKHAKAPEAADARRYLQVLRDRKKK